MQIPSASHYWLTHVRLPLSLLDPPHPQWLTADLNAAPLKEDLVAVDLEIQNGIITQIGPVGTATPGVPQCDRRNGLVWPCFVDMHTHLDKGHVWYRMPNPDGTFNTALKACQDDQDKHWNHEDLYRRMEFGLRCSYAHGTKAIRTHLDAWNEIIPRSLDVFKALQAEWRDRITMQAVSLVSVDYYLQPEGEQLADWMAEAGGVLGGVIYMSPDLDRQLDRVFQLAQERGLDLDFHTDESTDPADMTLRHVAQTAIRRQFSGRIVCGHCCSLSVQTPEVVQETMALVKEAGIGIVSLPMCNLYLQDSQPGRTPRLRGVTLIHELKQHGIPVAVASDNCRDPFFAYGDHDGLEVFKMAVRIAHLDRPWRDWPSINTKTAADLINLHAAGRIGVGLPADLVLFQARNFNELMARSQHDRIVLRQGQPIDTTPPDYAELDDLIAWETA